MAAFAVLNIPMPKIVTEQDKEEFRQRLCDAAEKLFAERGPEAVSMRQLAVALNVSAMTPYRYFRDKDEILAAVRTRGFERFFETMEAAYTDGDSGRAKGSAVRHAYLDFALNNPNTYKLMFDLNQPTERDFPELDSASRRAKLSMTRWVQDLITSGEITGDAEEIGEMYWAAVHGAVVLELADKLPPGSARRLQKLAARTLLKGLQSA